MALAAGLMAAGFAIQALGQYEASKRQARALKSEANTARMNAQAARLKAQADADLQMIQTRQVLAEQKTGFAAAGVSGGSVDAVMADSAINAEMDRLSIIFGGDVRSAAFMSEAEAKMKGARDVKEAGLFGLVSTGFKGAGSGLGTEV